MPNEIDRLIQLLVHVLAMPFLEVHVDQFKIQFQHQKVMSDIVMEIPSNAPGGLLVNTDEMNRIMANPFLAFDQPLLQLAPVLFALTGITHNEEILAGGNHLN